MTSLKAIVINPISKHTSTVFFLHGLGDTGDGWSSVGEMLSPSLPNTKFVFPHSPLKNVTLNGGALMPAWYDIKSLGGQAGVNEDKQGMYQSFGQIMELVDKEIQAGIPTNRIIRTTKINHSGRV